MENVTNNQDNIQKPKNKFLKIVKYVIISILVLYVGLVIVRIFQITDKNKEAEKVKEIHSIRLTMKDIDEANLPPMPDEALNNATVEGIDVNHNYVRDDVERFIFDKYKTKEERAAWMQYARAMGFVMTKAESKETLKAIMEEGDRADTCALDLYIKIENISLEAYKQKVKLIEDLVVNTESRKVALENGYENMTSSGPGEKPNCDIND